MHGIISGHTPRQFSRSFKNTLHGVLVALGPTLFPDQPRRLTPLHVRSRFLGREEFTSLELVESSFDFIADEAIGASQPLIFQIEQLECARDDLFRTLRMHPFASPARSIVRALA